MSQWEIAANGFNALSIFLAGRNRVHTWWTGIVGCLLFGYVFFAAKLYADLTLQVFFVITSAVGWWNWERGENGAQRPIRRTAPKIIGVLGVVAFLIVVGYGWLLHHFTDAYAPFLDSTVLAFSVLGQFLLMDRRLENWWCWLLVNTIAVPLYATRGLYLTSALSVGFWFNAIVAWLQWKKELRTAHEETI
jgi:nicotinamide mononucleotide transporter